VSIDTIERLSIEILVDTIDTWTDTLSTLNQHLGWRWVGSPLIMADASKCQSIHTSGSTLGQLSTDCWLSVDQMLIKMSIKGPSGVNVIEMSIECLSRCRLSVDRGSIKGTDWHSTTDAFSTHDPRGLYLSVSLNKVKFHFFYSCFSENISIFKMLSTINTQQHNVRVI